MNIAALGVLAGWRRRRTEHCEVLTLQLIDGTIDRSFVKVVVALSDEQICSLTRDLTRAAVSRGLVVWPKGDPTSRGLLDRLLDKALRRNPLNPTGRQPAMLRLPDFSAANVLATGE